MSEEKTILLDVTDNVATITLNRPDRYNAITPTLLIQLRDALKQVERDVSVRAILLTGAGRGFCAGADLGGMQADAATRQVNGTYEGLTQRYMPVIKALCTIEKPIIAAINGSAAGAGASIALACDLRVMGEKSSIAEVFSNIGLLPDAGSTWFLVRQVGYSRAFELTIEGKKIPASRCLELGLTNRVVPDDETLSEALSWAKQLAQRPTKALGFTKRALNKAQETGLMEMIEYEAHLQQVAIRSNDHAEGVSAFLEKRSPEFKGI
ncbi:MAG: enoyl-CoA hydratase-related protein [Chloroflexota bacterium]